MLYPLKFKPLFKERIWGGTTLSEKMNKKLPESKKIGESWEISAVEGDISVVKSGELKNNNLQELIEVYMGELVGERIYEKFGLEFPLLIKLIDARELLSIQVHPDDALAAQRHNSYGKTEMWYVVDAEQDSYIYLGFEKPVTKEEYLQAVENGTLAQLLKKVPVRPGSAFFIPAGTIHAIGKGLLIAEIQQTSDVTYRVDDWGRVDDHGNPRELHTELAVDAIDYGIRDDLDVTAVPVENTAVTLKKSPYFTTNLLKVNGSVIRDFAPVDSFVIYICIEGNVKVTAGDGYESLPKGESILVPAEENEIELDGQALLLEVYIEK